MDMKLNPATPYSASNICIKNHVMRKKEIMARHKFS